MAKLTIEELRRRRGEARRDLYLREGKFRGKIVVHMGTCGIAAGARDVMAAVLDEMERRAIRDVMVTTSGCAGLCSREPMMTVELANAAPVKYGSLTAEKARKILADHVAEGKVVVELAIGLGSERGG